MMTSKTAVSVSIHWSDTPIGSASSYKCYGAKVNFPYTSLLDAEGNVFEVINMNFVRRLMFDHKVPVE